MSDFFFEKLPALLLGAFAAYWIYLVGNFFFHKFLKPKKSGQVTLPPEVTKLDTIERLLGFNIYDYPTITKLYNKLENQKATYPKSCPEGVKILFDYINKNRIAGGEKTSHVFPQEKVLDLIVVSKRQQLIRKYS